MQNRALIITVGIAIFCIIIGIWLYLFLFGAPDDGGEVFSNLGVFPDNGASPEIIDDSPQQNIVNVAGAPLQQLTTKPVAGYSVTENDVRYVEAGTGYLFSINLDTGTETQLTNTTMAGTVAAVFSPNQSRVALTRFDDYTPVVTIGTVVGETLETTELEPGARNLYWQSNTQLQYTIARDGETVGYQQDLQEETRQELFVFDLVQTEVDWSNGQPIVWSAPALNFPSAAYEISGTNLTPLPVRRSALQILRFSDDTLVYTRRDGDDIVSISGDVTMAQSLLREKCVTKLVGTNLYCGGPVVRVGAETYFDWLQGQASFDDMLWRTDVATGVATLMIDPERVSGRPLDMITPQLGPQQERLFFINKTDQTLWLVDLNEV